MAWYWIVLIVIGYFIMGILTALIYSAYDKELDEDYLVVFAACWPVMLAFAILIAPFALLRKIIGKLIKR